MSGTWLSALSLRCQQASPGFTAADLADDALLSDSLHCAVAGFVRAPAARGRAVHVLYDPDQLPVLTLEVHDVSEAARHGVQQRLNGDLYSSA